MWKPLRRTAILGICAALAACAGVADEPALSPIRCVHLDAGVSASLRGLSAVDGRIAWAGGTGGAVLRTFDGGRTWDTVAVPGAAGLDFRDVEALDRESVLLMSAGRPARFFKTEDAGATWRQVHGDDREGVFFDSMAFWDRKKGLAFSDPVAGSFLVIATDDGGDSWRTIPAAALPAPATGEAGFAASGTSLAVAGGRDVWFATGGGGARVFHSPDGGASWSAAPAPLRQGADSQGVFSIAFRDPLHGVIVGGDYRSPDETQANAATTEDGGASWLAVEGSPPGGYRSAVAWLPGSGAGVWISTGPSGSDYSLDDGRTWSPLPIRGFHSLASADEGVLWASGADGALARCEWLGLQRRD